ncbi:MAG: FHA domain-containing protein [Chloroflexota bacterium]
MESFGKLVLMLPDGRAQEFELAKPSITLGRAATSDILLADAKTSRTHARVDCSAAGCVLTDLGSTNGTSVNGARVEHATLAPADLITVGDSTLRFEIAAPSAEPDLLRIETHADLRATLTQARLTMTLSDMRVPRLAIRTPNRTWEIPLTKDALTIGRQAECDIFLDDPKVSRQHARLEARGDAFVVRDLGSTNGTWVGDQRVETYTLQDGDTLSIGQARLVFKRGFVTDALTVPNRSAQPRRHTRRPVVIVPGAMGSDLWRGSERLWPNVTNLFAHPEVYCYKEGQPIQARNVVSEMVIVPNLVKLEQYSRLGDYLQEGLGYERGKDLFEFPYDWRQDNRVSARQLAAAIERWQIKSPVTIIAHSMGCMVSRYYIERCGGKSQVERLIAMGGPHYGGAQTVGGLLYGQGVLPFGLLGDKLRQVLITLPSVYQVLPTYPCVFDQRGQAIDVYTNEAWLPEPYRPLLRAAREFRRELGTRSSVPCVSVFGYGLKTVTRATVHCTTPDCWEKVDFAIEPGGDTTVPETSAVVEGSEIHPVQQYHGSLYVDNDVRMRLKLELTR